MDPWEIYDNVCRCIFDAFERGREFERIHIIAMQEIRREEKSPPDWSIIQVLDGFYDK